MEKTFWNLIQLREIINFTSTKVNRIRIINRTCSIAICVIKYPSQAMDSMTVSYSSIASSMNLGNLSLNSPLKHWTQPAKIHQNSRSTCVLLQKRPWKILGSCPPFWWVSVQHRLSPIYSHDLFTIFFMDFLDSGRDCPWRNRQGTGKMDKVNKRMAQAVAATHLARCLKASSLLEEDTLADTRGDSVERLESKT